MPNNEEKKYTVDDILREFEEGFDESSVQESISEENVEKAGFDEEEINLAADNFVEITEKISEQNEENAVENEAVEEITEDEYDEEDDLNICSEELEADRSEAENAEFSFNDEKTIEEMVLEEAKLWKENIETKEFTESDAALLVPDVQSEAAEKTETLQVISAETEKEDDITEKKEDSAAEIADNKIVEELQADNIIETEDVNDKFLKKFFKGLLPWKGDGIGEIIRKIIFLVAVTVFIGAGIMLVSTLMQSEEAVEEKKENQSIITTTVATTVDSEGNVVTIAPTEEEIAEHNFNVAEHFKSINEDYIGYLELDGCDIYEPIMQGDDNDYYLDHNYYGGTNKAGTVFLDYRCTVSEEYISPNIVFYGHNQEDGTMFGNLKEYKQNVEFYQENPLVKFSPEFETGEYVIYGYFITHVRPEQDSNGEVFHYHDYIEALRDEETFNWYINEIQERNQIVSPVDVQYGDKLLCLSTCSNEFSDSRFVVFARRLRDGETIDDFDFSEAYLNPYSKGVDCEAIMSNET